MVLAVSHALAFLPAAGDWSKLASSISKETEGYVVSTIQSKKLKEQIMFSLISQVCSEGCRVRCSLRLRSRRSAEKLGMFWTEYERGRFCLRFEF